MGKALDLTGQQFGKLTALSWTGETDRFGNRLWLCQCECGNFRKVDTHNLRKLLGGVKACVACATKASLDNRKKFMKERLQRQINVRRERLHGIWLTMRSRCNNPKTKAYPNYGGRGIKVCEEWCKSYLTFKEWAFANGYTDEMTIERKNVNGNYTPDNCTWIKLRQQFFNRRDTHYIEFRGKKIPLSKMIYDLGLEYSQILYYLKRYQPET